MTPEFLLALGAMFTGMVGAGIAIATSRTAASKTEVESLRATVVLLQAENVRLRERVDELEKENRELRDCLDKARGRKGAARD